MRTLLAGAAGRPTAQGRIVTGVTPTDSPPAACPDPCPCVARLDRLTARINLLNVRVAALTAAANPRTQTP